MSAARTGGKTLFPEIGYGLYVSQADEKIQVCAGQRSLKMWTINELFYGPESALTHIYEYSNLKPVEVGVVKEQKHPKEKKGNHGDVHLKVDMCCEACVRKVRRVLIELNGVSSININVPTKKVTITGDVKPEACLKVMAKIRKRASLWADAEGGGKDQGKKNKKKKDGNQAQNYGMS